MTDSHFLFGLSGNTVPLAAINVPAIGFQPVESNYGQSMLIIAEGNVNVFNFDNVKVKAEMIDMESKRAGGKSRTVMFSFTLGSREMQSLDDRIKNSLSYSLKAEAIQGNIFEYKY